VGDAHHQALRLFASADFLSGHTTAYRLLAAASLAVGGGRIVDLSPGPDSGALLAGHGDPHYVAVRQSDGADRPPPFHLLATGYCEVVAAPGGLLPALAPFLAEGAFDLAHVGPGSPRPDLALSACRRLVSRHGWLLVSGALADPALAAAAREFLCAGVGEHHLLVAGAALVLARPGR